MGADKQANLKVYLTGPLYLTIDAVPVTAFHSLKTQAIFAYLILEGNRPINRDDLATMFWDGYIRKSGLANLRMCLSNLRQVLGTRRDVIITTRNTVQLNIDADNIWCDIVHIENVIQDGSMMEHQRLQESLKAYERILLQGFDDLDSPAFLAWLKQKRAHYAELIAQFHQTESIVWSKPLLTTKTHNLPRTLKTLFGRKQNIAELSTLVTSPQTPLITLLGPGGVGKTELALAVARQHTEQFSGGVWFVPLDKIQATDSAESAQTQVLQQIAHALRFIPRDTESLLEQVKQYLQERHTLLIVDNFEHVLAAAPVIFELLRDSHQLKVIVTSRKRLNDFSESIYHVGGLEIDNTIEAASVQLFQERLQRLGHGISADNTAAEVEAIASICRLVNGSPLGIELATTLCETQNPIELYAQLQSDLTPLATTMWSVPERQRSLQAVIRYSWEQLTWDEKRVMLQCTVICGTFSAEIAQMVTGAPFDTLTLLAQYGFINTTQDNQYRIHPQIRTFYRNLAAEKFALNGWLIQAEHRHATAYLQWVVQSMNTERRSVGQIATIQQRLPDIEKAWTWCVKHNLTQHLNTASLPLAHYLRSAGLSGTGVTWLEAALEVQDDDVASAYLHNALATLYIARDDVQKAQQHVTALEPIVDKLPLFLQAQTRLIEGHLSHQQGNIAESVTAYKAVAGYSAESESNLSYVAASAAYHLGKLYESNKEWEAAETVWEQGFQLAVTNNDRWHQILLSEAIGQANYNQADYDGAWRKFSRGLTLAANDFPVPDLHYYTALTAYELKRFNDASHHLMLALPIYEQYQMHQHQIATLLLLSQVKWLLAAEQAAQEAAKMALDLAQRISDIPAAKQANELLKRRVTIPRIPHLSTSTTIYSAL